MIVSDDRVAAFVGKKLGVVFAQPFTALGIERRGQIVAGIVFNCWTGPDAQLSIAADRGRITKRFLARVGRYLTDELGCIRATIETEHEHVAKLALRMGGKVEGVKRNLFGAGRDATLIGIQKEDWFLR